MELKKLWNMKAKIKLIVIGAFDIVTKGLLRGLEDLEIRGRMVTIQTTTFLRMARIPRRVLETCHDSSSDGGPSANADVKNCQGVRELKKKNYGICR